MKTSLNNEPVSTENHAFLGLSNEHLANDGVIIVLVRHANSAGAKDWLLIRTKEDFDSLLKKQTPKTSITVFFKSAFALKGKVNEDYVAQTKILFDKEYDEYEGLDVICLEQHLEDKRKNNIMFLQNFESIAVWLRDHTGCEVLIGTMKFWYDNNIDFLTAYVPEKDGQIIPGAY